MSETAPLPTAPIPAPHPLIELPALQLPPWAGSLAENLMDTAEGLFTEPKSGAAKKAWVRSALLGALQSVDVAVIPNWIENPAKAAIVDFLIEVLWSARWGGHKHQLAAKKRRIAQAHRRIARGLPVRPALMEEALLDGYDVDIDDVDDDTAGED